MSKQEKLRLSCSAKIKITGNRAIFCKMTVLDIWFIICLLSLGSEVYMIGKVKWFNAQKGFGFINRGNGKDIFVHYSQIQDSGYRTLIEGEEVEFDLVKTERGDQARNVVKID